VEDLLPDGPYRYLTKDGKMGRSILKFLSRVGVTIGPV